MGHDIVVAESRNERDRLLGIKINGPCDAFCDNESVVKNTTRPESPIKKKHNSIAYHEARGSIASGAIRIAKEDGGTNIADLFTKLLAHPKLMGLASMCMWEDN